MNTNCRYLDSAIAELRAEVRCETTADPRTIVVTTGRAYPDGELVEVFVRLSADGERIAVSDGGLSEARRSLYGSNLTSSALALWEEIRQDHGVDYTSGRVYKTGALSAASNLIGLVADAVLALESVRHMVENARTTFTDKLQRWLRQDAELVVKDDKVLDRFDVEQKITAVVDTPRGDIVVQAAAGRTGSQIRRSAEHAHFVFSGLSDDWPIENRIIVLERLPMSSDAQLRTATAFVHRLSEIAYVGTFEAQLQLNAFLKVGAPPVRDMALQTLNQEPMAE